MKTFIKLTCLLLFPVLISSCGSSKKAATVDQEILEAYTKIAAELPDSVEVLPTFLGGDFSTFRDWVSAEVTYPDKIVDDYIQGRARAYYGRVIAQFVIERDGSVQYIEILSSPHPSFGHAVKNVISKSPRWTPAMQRGIPVRIRLKLSIDFTLPVDYKADIEQAKREYSRKKANLNAQRR